MFGILFSGVVCWEPQHGMYSHPEHEGSLEVVPLWLVHCHVPALLNLRELGRSPEEDPLVLSRE